MQAVGHRLRRRPSIPNKRAYEKQAELLFVWSLNTSDPKLIRRLRERAFEALAFANSADDDSNRILQEAWDEFQKMQVAKPKALGGVKGDVIA